MSGLAFLPLALLIAGCPSVMPPPDGNDNDNGNGDEVAATVRMQNIAFVPLEVTITVGETVRWVNDDIVPHTTTSGNPGDADAGSLWNSGLMGGGASFEHTFNEAGEFVYFCEVHPTQMRDAMVIVQPADGQ
jgi:plastocyanin